MNDDTKIGIVIATLNCADLLAESLVALLPDKAHFDRLIIIDNGDQGVARIDPKITIVNPARNLGCAASWNLGMDMCFSNPEVGAVIQLNDDIVLHSGQVDLIRKTMAGMTTKAFFTGLFGWSVWGIKRELYERMGANGDRVFDEAFWPAYCEDNDFHRRLNLINPELYAGDLQELTPEVKRLSMTARKFPVINHERSLRYYIKKWGGEIGEETLGTPFDRGTL